MAPEYLLDTGAANLVAAKHPGVLARIARAGTVYLPMMALAELYYGAFWHAYMHQSTKYLDRSDALLKEYEGRLLADNVVTAHYYGAIRAELRSKGIVIQHSDMWIAALAGQYALTIATTDQHLGNISALRYEIWPLRRVSPSA